MTPVVSTFMAVAAAAAPFSAPTTIDNPYLPLTKWKSCEFRGLQDDGTRERGVLRLLKRARSFTINGQRVPAVVIQDNAAAWSTTTAVGCTGSTRTCSA